MKLLKQEEVNLQHKKDVSLLNSEIKRLTDIKNKLQQFVSMTDIDGKKLRTIQDYNQFVKDLENKKDIAYKELVTIKSEIEKRQDIIEKLIDKEDELAERKMQLDERERTLSLRESLVRDIENKINNYERQ